MIYGLMKKWVLEQAMVVVRKTNSCSIADAKA